MGDTAGQFKIWWVSCCRHLKNSVHPTEDILNLLFSCQWGIFWRKKSVWFKIKYKIDFPSSPCVRSSVFGESMSGPSNHRSGVGVTRGDRGRVRCQVSQHCPSPDISSRLQHVLCRQGGRGGKVVIKLDIRLSSHLVYLLFAAHLTGSSWLTSAAQRRGEELSYSWRFVVSSELSSSSSANKRQLPGSSGSTSSRRVADPAPPPPRGCPWKVRYDQQK